MPPSGGVRTPLVGYSWGAPARMTGGGVLSGAAASAFTPSGIFSPGLPLVPTDPERVRVRDFPPGYNLDYTPRSWTDVGFAELRMLAEYYLVAIAIETRKDQVGRFDWQLVSRDPENPKSDAERRIKAATEFWEHPDGDVDFATWLRMALHEMLTTDAPAFEIRKTRGGDVSGIDVVDGATIKLLLDDTGRKPAPPAPAYEQVIRGRPWRLLTSDELLYLPRNPRPGKVYGFSPVEQILLYINIGLRRAITQLGYYTSGNVPEGILSAPADWNAEQIRQFQEWFDSILAGNLHERNKLIWAPAGSKYQAFKTSPIEVAFEEWLARIVCYTFALSPTQLVNQVNRATGATMQEAAENEGNQAALAWVKRLVDRIEQRHKGNTDLEFVWQTDQPLDAEDQATMLIGLVKEGIITRNEARDERGMNPEADADLLMVDTTQGPVLLKDIINPPEPVATPSPDAGGAAEGDPAAPSAAPDNEEGAAGKAIATFRQGFTPRRRARPQSRLDGAERSLIAAEAVSLLRAARGPGSGGDQRAAR
ncbi:MAG: phage portal protein [Candidatus Binataceae bacterium]|nr:phage portal protein [Candidatus Binataceae bacterium]